MPKWSGHLPAEELFNVLTPPKRRNFTGSYRVFLDFELVPKLQSCDLLVALKWVEKQGLRCFGHSFERLADAIMLKAWEHLDLPDIVESFTKVALIQWREHQKIITFDNEIQAQFELSLVNNVDKRRKLVEQVKQNPTLRKRLELGGKAFIFEALQKASDQWWVAPFVKAIEAGVKGE